MSGAVTAHTRAAASARRLDALELIIQAADHSGGRVVTVDAIDDAAIAFYEHHGFLRVPDTKRLVMKIATARDALA